MTGSADDHDIASQLERLFDDPRLDVAPAAGATDAVVRGARRVQRRRRVAYAAGGTTAAALVLVGGLTLALGGAGQTNEAASPPPQLTATTSPPAATTTTSPRPSWKSSTAHATTAGKARTTSAAVHHRRPRGNPAPEPTTTPPAPSEDAQVQPLKNPVLGPDGYGDLKIGMSLDDAKATGMLEESPDGARYTLKEGSRNIAWASFTDDQKLGCLYANEVRSPESIGVGSPDEQVEKTYPDGARSDDAERGRTFYSAAAGDSAKYVFVFHRSGASAADPVDEFGLQSTATGATCDAG